MKISFKEFGEYLKEKRLNVDLSQVQVAKSLGYKSQFIANWERGVSSPPMNTLRKLITLYKIPESEILDVIMDLQRAYLKKELSRQRRSKSS